MRLQIAAGVAVAALVGGCGGEEGLDASLPVTTVQEPERTTRYPVPSSSMEPTLHCAQPAAGCEAASSDEVVAESPVGDPERGDVVVFKAPQLARERCGAGNLYIKRIVGLPGEQLELRTERGLTYVYINEKRLDEPYIAAGRRDSRNPMTYQIPENEYFVMGDNRGQSCDSREWGSVSAAYLLGRVVSVVRSE